MFRSVVPFVLTFSLAVSLTIMAVPSSAKTLVDQDLEPTVRNGNQAFQVYTDVIVAPVPKDADTNTRERDESGALSPFTYKSVMLQSSGRRARCWRCSSPCSAYMCCDDGYPQCCLVRGRCMCCRF